MPIRSPGRIVVGREIGRPLRCVPLALSRSFSCQSRPCSSICACWREALGSSTTMSARPAAAEDDRTIERERRAGPLAILKSEDRHGVQGTTVASTARASRDRRALARPARRRADAPVGDLIADREQLQHAARQLAHLAGVLAGRHRLHGIGNGADDRELAGQARDVEDVADVLVEAAQHQGAVAGIELVQHQDQDADAGAGEQVDGGEVDDDVPGAVLQQLEDVLLELERRAAVDLRARVEDGHLAGRAMAGDLELHGQG